MNSQPSLLLVHGSVVNADLTWSAQKPLASRFEIVAPNRRGFPPGPDVERVDFEDEAVWLEQFLAPGAHLVGHSYGGVVALLAAARHPELVRSLTVIEPPAFGVARGNPAADAFTARIEEHWTSGPRDPAEFLRRFLEIVGSWIPPGNFTPELLQGARTLRVERSPAEAAIPLDELARAPFPKLVVSGGHSAAFEAVCDVLEQRLGAERAVLPGAGHSVQRLGEPFNELLSDFVTRAEGDFTTTDIADRVMALRTRLGRGVTVGISGVDCAGKSTLAEQLRRRLEERGVPVVLLEGDELTRSSRERYAEADEGLGYYRDSFDYRAVFEQVLPAVRRPFAGPLSLPITDWERDAWAERVVELPPSAVVVVEGCFLFAGARASEFDLSVWLDLPLEEVVPRALRRPRDLERMGGPDGVRERYESRYVPGQRLHLERDRPHKQATVVVPAGRVGAQAAGKPDATSSA